MMLILTIMLFSLSSVSAEDIADDNSSSTLSVDNIVNESSNFNADENINVSNYSLRTDKIMYDLDSETEDLPTYVRIDNVPDSANVNNIETFYVRVIDDDEYEINEYGNVNFQLILNNKVVYTINEMLDGMGNAETSYTFINEGNYTLVITYLGDSIYAPSDSVSTDIEVSDTRTSTVMGDIDTSNIVLNENNTIGVQLTDGTDPISDENVVFEIRDSASDFVYSKIVKSNSSGIALINYNFTLPDTYTVIATFAGDNNYKPSSSSKSFTLYHIRKNVDVNLINLPYNTNVNLNTSIVAVIYDEETGNVVTSGNARLEIINGINTIYSETVNVSSDGLANFTYNFTETGSYNIRVSYLDNFDYATIFYLQPLYVVDNRKNTMINSIDAPVTIGVGNETIISTMIYVDGTTDLVQNGTALFELIKNNAVIYSENVTVSNGYAYINYMFIGGGAYTITVTYSPNNDYATSTKSQGLYVIDERISTELKNLNINNFIVNGDNSISINIFESDGSTKVNNGTVLFEIKSNGALVYSENIEVFNGIGFINYKFTSTGSYVIYATYLGNEYYTRADTSSLNVNIVKEISIVEIYYSEYTDDKPSSISPETVDLYVMVSYGNYYSLTEGIVNFTIESNGVVLYNEEINLNGNSTFTVPYDFSTYGTYTISAKYIGSDFYSESTDSYTFDVVKQSAEFVTDGDPTNIYYVNVDDTVNINEEFYFDVQVMDSSDYEVYDGPTLFEVKQNGVVLYYTLLDGDSETMYYSGSYTFTEPGEYDLVFTYVGEEMLGYACSTPYTHTITVEDTRLPSIINSSNTVVGSNVNMSVTVFDSDYNYISKGDVLFKISNGTDVIYSETKTVDDNGNALINYTFQNIGDYTVTATYLGNETYAPNTISSTITIVDNRLNTNIGSIVISPEVTINKESNISVNVTDGANIITSGNVFFVIMEGNSLVYSKNVTLNSTGEASINYTFLTEGDYTVTATYLGDENYKSSTVNNAFTLNDNRIVPTIDFTNIPSDTIINNEINVSVVVTEGNNPITNGNVSFEIRNDGTLVYSVNKSVNSTGEVLFTYTFLNEGTYDIRVNYLANDNYKSSSKTQTIIVDLNRIKGELTNLTIPSSTNINNNTLFEVNVVEIGTTNKVQNGTVLFEIIKDNVIIDSVEVNVINGNASLNYIFYENGTYFVKVTYLGNENYKNSNSSTVNININDPLGDVEFIKEIYISNTGSDITGNGQYTNPFASITHGLKYATNGSTIYLMSGTYYVNYTYKINDLNITIRAFNNTDVIIDRNHHSGLFTIGEGSTVKIIGLSFINGYDSYAIVNNGVLTILNSTFADGNNYIFNNNQLTLAYSNLTNSNSQTIVNNGIGNVIYSNFTNNNNSIFNNKTITVINSTFDNNYGKVIETDYGSSTYFINSTISNNKGNSGFYDLKGSYLIYIVNSTFLNNDAGVILVINPSGNDKNSLVVLNSEFINNSASKGSAIYVDKGNLTVQNSLFMDNNALSDGGAIYNINSLAYVKNNTFINNSAVNRGGSIYSEGSTNLVYILSNTFTKSSSATGGVLYSKGITYLQNNRMSDSTATLGSYIYNGNRITTLNLVFQNQTSSSNPVEIIAYVTDDMGNNVTGQSVTFYVEGKQIKADLIEGVAKINYTFSDEGIYIIDGNYSGSRNLPLNIYGGLSNLAIIKSLSNIDVSDVIAFTGSNLFFNGTLYDIDNNVLANQHITLIVNGQTYDLTTDGEGKFSKDFNGILSGGIYNVLINYNGDITYAPTIKTALFTINTPDTSLNGFDVNMTYGDNLNYYVQLVNNNNISIFNQTIVIKIDGNEYKIKTNETGWAFISLSNLLPGNYIVEVNFNGGVNNYHQASSTQNNIIINKIKTILISEDMSVYDDGKDKYYKVLLTDYANNPLVNKVLTITIGFTDYTVTTDEEGYGIVNLTNLEKGIYAVSSNYIDSNGVYATSSSEATLYFFTEYVIRANLTNNEIQEIINNASSGGKIVFEGQNYENLNLLINKPLRIISNVGTVIKSNSNIFNIKDTNGVTISGFTFIGDNVNSLINVDNSNNVNINNNKLSSGNISINIISSNNVGISENSITKNNYGIMVTGSSNIEIVNNIIKENSLNGIYASNEFMGSTYDTGVNNLKINSNTIESNSKTGIYLIDAKGTIEINSNKINNNGENGIYLNNIISSNLLVKFNTISNHKGNLNSAIKLGSSYNLKNSVGIAYNSLSNNDYGIDTRDTKFSSSNPLLVGDNWYGGSAPYPSNVNGSKITANITQTSPNKFVVNFYDIEGNLVNNLLPDIVISHTVNGGKEESEVITSSNSGFTQEANDGDIITVVIGGSSYKLIYKSSDPSWTVDSVDSNIGITDPILPDINSGSGNNGGSGYGDITDTGSSTGDIKPTNPNPPVGPTNPTGPTTPTDPVIPSGPGNSTGPVGPTDPSGPVDPVGPTDPVGPGNSTGPVGPTNPTTPTNPTNPNQNDSTSGSSGNISDVIDSIKDAVSSNNVSTTDGSSVVNAQSTVSGVVINSSSIVNSGSLGQSSASSDSVGQSSDSGSQKSYEVEKNSSKTNSDPTNIILTLVIALVVLVLLIVGYRRYNKEDE